MRASDLDTLINNANQAFSTYTSAADKSKTNVKKALETAIRGALQVLQQVFNEDGSFKNSIAESDRPAFVEKIKVFFNPLAPQLTDIYKTHYVKHLTETAITDLTALCEIITNSKISDFSKALSTIINGEVTEVRKKIISVVELEQFFDSMLSGEGAGKYRRDRYTAPRATYGEPEPTPEEKQAVMIELGRDIEILRAMLDNHGITKEQVSDLISKNWDQLIKLAQPELISTILTHPKAIEAQKINAQKDNLRPWREYQSDCTDPLTILVYRTWTEEMVSFEDRYNFFPIQPARAVIALEAISSIRYFELTRGANELRTIIRRIDFQIRKESPAYKIILSHQEPVDNQLKDSELYIFLKEGKLHYKAIEYDNNISTGALDDNINSRQVGTVHKDVMAKLKLHLSTNEPDRSPTEKEEENIHRYFMTGFYANLSIYAPGKSIKVAAPDDLIAEKKCVAVLRKRLQEIEFADSNILKNLSGLVNDDLAKIQGQQKSDSSFKTQITACKLKIEKILNSSTNQYREEHRADIKIRWIIEALLDAHNEIKGFKQGRSFFGGLFGGSTTALQIEVLLQTIQQKLSDHPNYTYTLKKIEGEKIELKWTEEFKDDGARLAITGGTASTLQIN